MYYIVWTSALQNKSFATYNEALDYYFDLIDAGEEIVEISDNNGNSFKRSW